MKGILKELDLLKEEETQPRNNNNNNNNNNGACWWRLLPMIATRDLQTSHLGDLLEHALERVREELGGGGGGGGVVFLGMDAPELALDDIVQGLRLANNNNADNNNNNNNNNNNTAVLCPADDGGYGMLCVPSNAPLTIFRGVHWSHSLTAVSQIKALTDCHLKVSLGTLMYDIDEPEDVHRLCQRLFLFKNNNGTETKREEEEDTSEHHPTTTTTTMVLDLCSGGGLPSSSISSQHPVCFYTRKALGEAGLLSNNDGGGG